MRRLKEGDYILTYDDHAGKITKLDKDSPDGGYVLWEDGSCGWINNLYNGEYSRMSKKKAFETISTLHAINDYVGNKDYQLNKAVAVMDKILVIFGNDDHLMSSYFYTIQRIRKEIEDFKMGLNEPNDEDG